MKKIVSSCFIALSFLFVVVTMQSWQPLYEAKREFYQLTVYHFSNATQEKTLDNYLQNALLPALHKMKILRMLASLKIIQMIPLLIKRCI